MSEVAALRDAEQLLAGVERRSRRFAEYDSYKATSIDWLGDIPEHWDTKHLKYIVTIKSGENITAESISVDGAYPVYGGNGRRGFTSDFTHNGEFVLVGRQGALCGNVHRVGGQFWASEHCAVGTCKPGVSVDWCAALIEAMNLRRYSETAAQPGLAVERVLRLPVPSPPLDEQQAIARFLDRETAKIDSLVAKKRRLIELLAEKRTALISHAVTKGLNPDAPTKPSGIDWLGDVPTHWDVSPLRRVATVVDCKHRTVPFVDDGVPLASIAEVQSFEVELASARNTTEDEYRLMIDGGRKPEIGDIIYSRNATVGLASVVTTGRTFCMGQDVCMIRLCGREPFYLTHLLRSPMTMQQVASFMIGATFRRINVSQIKALIICDPPELEQSEIVQYCGNVCDRIDPLVQKVNKAIDRLNEYRSSLISAAVTGQIDVRKEVANAG